jgi:DNA excision repair protein ERCC-2
MEKKVRLPIRKLVEFILRSGDIDSRYAPRDRMTEGTRLHRTLQKKSAEKYESYISEVRLTAEVECRGTPYVLEGRADGIFTDGGRTYIDEIKTTVSTLETLDENNITHWAQARCYAFIYASQNALDVISVRLTYSSLETGETKHYVRDYSFGELQTFLTELLEKYAAWAAFSAEWAATRDASVKELQFPFPEYRKGQRELAVRVYRTIEAGKKLFAQAPTGTGKTVSALFPAVKAMGEGKTSKIFYLTAKTITRQVAEEAFCRMRQGGLRLKTLTLTAKEKICFREETSCRPEVCAYAKGYFDRANDAVYDVITHCDSITRSVIEEYAEKHTACPFELALDVSLWVDCVVCDYNYVFDPRAYLRRFFADGEGGDYVFLIDEAHNLADRAREMFSAQLTKTRFYDIKKRFKGRNKQLDKVLNGINKYMLELRKQCLEQGFSVTPDKPEALLEQVAGFTSVCELMLKENGALGEDTDFLQLYFEALNFALVCDFYDERYTTFVEADRGEVSIKLFCLDPSFLLSEAMKRGGSAVLFSATLTPLGYFRDILGGDAGDSLLALDSPFDSGSLCLLTADRISTTFKNREQSAGKIAGLIGSFVSRKTGNYIVYFPSYKYMKDVFTQFAEAFPHIHAVEQGPSMPEEEREKFLSAFVEEPEETLVAFCVLGGIFSEGIDLVGNRLIGTVIVSVGLPQLSVQQNIIRDYFNARNGMGFEYAYMYPGMNKVLQAAGRVIRSQTDVGAVLLVDERFGRRDYVRLFPRHWQGCRRVRDSESLEEVLDAFWEDRRAYGPEAH